ncbi:UDP-2,3-diacylglucosamine diphosphatase [Cardinium endosymbiont of Culicoides punctatus]|uniref:UDP-2,3-diacylglucosamine diphosphatase n=1 Tax=Cardinium endosymbiont of Culicoides punctatus TaxID=2304601 RepID=UPI0010D5F046|nr:UDP-2,3-diacylglucosamine diphosphatase [Cardinium endosymbiont of Culicoides punctatus]TDG95723.1 UDP-2,3-diacylglucosamine hydrolase [Cardinium endosymbiont of Culicoides punctatus]
MLQIEQLQDNKKVFFISDLHLPIQASGSSIATYQEDKIVNWLDYIKPQAQALFLLGDVFNFWFEYKYLIPRGCLKFQAKLLEFYKEDIFVYFFVGNRDCWSIDYLTQTCGVQILHHPQSIMISNQSFFIGHGDTIGVSSRYKMIRKLYNNSLLLPIVRAIPADWLYGAMCFFLKKKTYTIKDNSFFIENDRIFRYCRDNIEPIMHHDFYIFGHTHAPFIEQINEASSYCNTGDWISNYTYGCFDGFKISLCKF